MLWCLFHTWSLAHDTTDHMNWSVFFPPLASWVFLQSERWNKKQPNNENKVSCPTVMSCNHLLFLLGTSALAKFMWPLPWLLTSLERHLFEFKNNWHNPPQNLLMWFMFNHQAAAKTVYYLRAMWQEGFTFGFIQIFVPTKTKSYFRCCSSYTLRSIALWQ